MSPTDEPKARRVRAVPSRRSSLKSEAETDQLTVGVSSHSTASQAGARTDAASRRGMLTPKDTRPEVIPASADAALSNNTGSTIITSPTIPTAVKK